MKTNFVYTAALSALLTGAALATPAQAAEYKTILIHGFQADQLNRPNSTNVELEGEEYWSSFWINHADERIDWPSYERLQGKIATDYIWPKLKAFAENGTCNPGCVFVTHSTGDLVARYILDNQATWLENAGLQPLNIVATFDLAGAGGGSELADTAINAATSGGVVGELTRQAVEAWLGSMPEEFGIMWDLKVNNARQVAQYPSDNAPRLRFVADASDYYGLTSGFLPGNDDGVVSTHSSCGASTKGDFGSCSTSVAINGQLASQDDAVTSFMPYHYPLLMSAEYSHGNLPDAGYQGKVTAARTQFNAGYKTISYNTYEETTGSWFWKKTYRYVSESNSQSFSQLILNSL
ncbi:MULTISPECIES: hypothetical protein [Pseudoalteromonas]|uniref:Alpha/beta hydrolase n=2 Tax=Pseudoalteromonas TaxID=53246 RepID=A0A8I2KP81_9GAMM|nr:MULTISPECIES: hypothetical protein [Pseudoalteromonas]KID39526.1 hypothetical protein QT15_01055 [Pseudoalteromonas flavipulchra NCIMB 2033 = ATCC BAA-314]KJY93038.1 hypothetical protein TW75_00335 [Pseudoalteromonas piscicida]KJZ03962.1 hypothetical protein TW73_05700 [Pseudoalteromonas piscicida]MBD0784002.1 hypothetical protein [Pseudoalteromonas flavipulchra]MBE0372150.1 hypothetical protein [Pseudoalteromonas flavipulchra NCIMB 2033 = ATCC BAA-314]